MWPVLIPDPSNVPIWGLVTPHVLKTSPKQLEPQTDTVLPISMPSSLFTSEDQAFQPLRGFQDEWAGNQSDFWRRGEAIGGGMDHFLPGYVLDQGNDEVRFDPVPAAVEVAADISAAAVGTSPAKPSSSEISEISVQMPSGLLNRLNLGYDGFGDSNDKERRPPSEGVRPRELSTEEVMRAAAARFIHLSSRTECDPSALVHPFGKSFAGLADEEMKSVDLAGLLLAAAETVSIKRFDRARVLLSQCQKSSSRTGDPVQRVVYYFSEALQERIDLEKRSLSSKRPRELRIPAQELMKEIRTNHPMKLVTQQKLPFSRLVQFTSMQTIIDNVASAKRIHMIDLSIKHGLQWTIFMQALSTRSSCPVDYLKISAVGPSEKEMATAGKSLVSFADSLALPFGFKAVTVPDMKDLREEMFEVEEGEVLGVYSSTDMNVLIARPEGLENLMRVVRKLRPRIMTVTDFEARHNSPAFISRFTEALFYHSAFFDCLDAAMGRDDVNRVIIETFFCSEEIKSVVAAEGSDRVMRWVGLSVWRAFFARFGLVEADLNEWSQYQGRLLTQSLSHGTSWALIKNGKSLMVAWKGTPLIFISAWKFE